MTKEKKPHPTTDNGIKSQHEDINFLDDSIQKNSFVIYSEDYDTIRKLPDPDRLQLLDAIFKYHRGEDIGSLSFGADLVFSMMKPRFDRNILRYRDIVIRNRINGQSGGRPRNNPDGFSENPNNPSVTLHDHEHEHENDRDSVFYAWQKEKFWIDWIDFLKSKKQFYGKNEIGQIKILYDDAGGDMQTAAEILKTARRGNFNQWIKPPNGKLARGSSGGSEPLPTNEDYINSKIGR